MKDQNWNRSTSSQYVTDEMLSTFVKEFLPTSQLEISISCRNLCNTDIISKSDPYCTVWMQEPRWQDVYQEVARTEVIKNSLNPQFVKKVILTYSFESVQKLKFEIWDEDIKGKDLLGRFETTLGDLIGKGSGRQFIGKLTGGGRNTNRGEIIIVAEELTGCKQIAEIHFSAKNLLKLSRLWSNDPFLVISRLNEDGSYSVVAKTEFAKKTRNPKWKPITIRATALCNGDFDRNIKIDCYDHRKGGSHKLIGTCHTSLRSLSTISDDRAPMKLMSSSGSTGILKVSKINLVEDISFLDYIRNGTQLHFAVAIDFTASNGAFTDPKSLHHLSEDRQNFYEIGLQAVGEIIQQYDSTQMFPAFGFGAKLPQSDEVSHQFALNSNSAHPYCSGIEDILRHYRNQLQTIKLYGPTKFAPVISSTSAIARQFQDGKHYYVLLIITDGIILDMSFTKHAIIDASTLPMSIIIGMSLYSDLADSFLLVLQFGPIIL